MQHAVGAPLPPPHQPGQGPAAGWSPAAQHPGHPGGPPGPAPTSPPAPGFTGPPPGHPAPPSHLPHPAPPQHAPAAPIPDTTGHVQLPPGGPVAMPSAPGAPDPAATTLAVLLIGPAGAGKTSVAKYWADHRRVPTAHISLDDVREWVRSGFADPQSGWNDHSEAQYRLARRTCGFAARNFLANGISCILDDAVFPDRPVVGLGGWKRHVGPGLLPVVLLPGLEIVLERNAERSGNRRLTDEEVARIHGRMAGWYGSGLPIIDNSQLDVPSTARVLDEVLARSLASPPQW
ncbi:Pro-rich N-terminal domain-containing protein [Streptomyces mirabilis]|uniref:Pro-rich N-terminal domain-containing protein n=1 Tax=Streptomyces TaxID=1883 RepID=UPI000BB0DD3D|nr:MULTISPECIES: Pro-rich N-terminal domain-containing protein [Streptomyces]MCX4432455.1 ATP-binding protein [Streptomyces mirabilis]PBD00538.1 adenylate kinase family enzyme [Streptomyces sp. Ag82_O1-15]SOE77346.1 Adenylate kinase [Streptomyces sp. OV198]